jgi:hypothetical protein
MANKRSIIPKPALTISDILDNYIELHVRENLKSDHSKRVAEINCETIRKHFGELAFNQVKIFHLLKFKKERKEKDQVGQNTIKRDLAVFRSALQKALDFELVDQLDKDGYDYSKDYKTIERLMANITKHIPSAVRRKVCPSWQEIDDICNQFTRSSFKEYVWIASRIGYRKEELLGLHFRDLRLSERELKLDDSKTGYPRTTPLTNEMFIFFRNLYKKAERINGRDVENYPIFPIAWHTFIRHWRKAQITLGIVDDNGKALYHPHDLRKLSVRYLKEKCGFDRDMICDVYTGHRSDSLFESTYNIRNADSYNHYKERALSI